MKLLLICFLIFEALVESSYQGYYWKEYSSVIPPDAIPGGSDMNGKETYVGQTYIHSHGIFPVQIYSGMKELEVACYGPKKTTKIIKILCARNKEKFAWMATTAKTFQMDTIGKHPVIGGYDSVDANKGMLNVGRIMYQGVLKIGYIAGYLLEAAIMTFVHENKEQKANAFEVLVFDVTNPDCKKVNNRTDCTCLEAY